MLGSGSATSICVVFSVVFREYLVPPLVSICVAPGSASSLSIMHLTRNSVCSSHMITDVQGRDLNLFSTAQVSDLGPRCSKRNLDWFHIFVLGCPNKYFATLGVVREHLGVSSLLELTELIDSGQPFRC